MSQLLVFVTSTRCSAAQETASSSSSHVPDHFTNFVTEMRSLIAGRYNSEDPDIFLVVLDAAKTEKGAVTRSVCARGLADSADRRSFTRLHQSYESV